MRNGGEPPTDFRICCCACRACVINPCRPIENESTYPLDKPILSTTAASVPCPFGICSSDTRYEAWAGTPGRRRRGAADLNMK